jgi:uncharacterized membrane protein
MLGVLGLAVSGETQADGVFYNLGPGQAASGLSYDGSMAAGTNFAEYFVWTADGGIVGIGGQVAGNGVGGQAKMSDDGMRVSGTDLSPASGLFEMSYYDVAKGGWTHLGGIGAVCTTGAGPDETSSGWGISNDGSSVVGLGWFEFCGPAHGIQWFESSGMTNDLGSTVVDRSSRANAANMDGSVVVGWQDDISGFRQAAVWDGGVQSVITTMSGDPVSEATDVDASGDWVVGIASFATADEAWRWSAATGVEQLGMDCPGCFFPRGFATAVSNDGSVVVGFNRGLGGPPTSGVGFIWTEETGMVRLNDYLVDAGVDTQGFNFSLPLAISGDGRTIAGLGLPEGVPFGGDGFVVTIFPEVETLAAAFDIKPGSCPNPLNIGSNGVLPTAVLWTDELDVAMIDIDSIELARADGMGGSVVPFRTNFEDVGTPFDGEPCDCHEMGGDGYDDLTMKFRTQDVVEALELDSVEGFEFVELIVTGTLLDGTPFEGTDCVRINAPGGHRGMGLPAGLGFLGN